MTARRPGAARNGARLDTRRRIRGASIDKWQCRRRRCDGTTVAFPSPILASARRARSAPRVREATARVRGAAWPIAQTAMAAGAAWYITHTLLGHAQPFFAPIAAAVSLSATDRQRGRRALQMIGGVCLGIGVAELLHLLLGYTAVSIGVVAFVAMCLAVLSGVGFVGQGMMFVNQAAASAILVIALHRTGTASERLVDALVGGGVALVVSQLLFPPDPLKLLRAAEHTLLCALSDTLAELLRRLQRSPSAEDMWMLTVSQGVHAELAALAQARASARHVARLTRHRRSSAAVAAEDRRAAHLDLLGNDVLSLLRAAGGHLEEDPEPLPEAHARAVGELAEALRVLSAARPGEAVRLAHEAERSARGSTDGSPRSALVASLVGATAADVGRVAGDV
jgi:uncharacterized membrane protein YgaE (UPF0421/DUF939 family)